MSNFLTSPKPNISYNSWGNFLSSATQTDDYVAVVTTYTINPLNRDSSYSIEAYAKITSNGIPIDAGQLTIGNATINADSDNLYHYTFPLADGKALFGTSQNVSFSNYNTRTLRTESQVLVVPKEFYPSSISLPASTIDRTTDYHLTWAVDPSNEFQKVQIQLIYDKGISQSSDPGMPSAIADLVYNVSDNGSFTIPQSDLSRFPKGSFVDLSISRAWLDSTSGSTDYVSVVAAKSVPLLVVEPNSNPMSINGPDLVCTSENYSVDNLPSGMSVTWSVSPIGICTLSCTDCQQTTLTKNSEGNIILTANVHNSSKSNLITKSLPVGVPLNGSVFTSPDQGLTLKSWAEGYNYIWEDSWVYWGLQGTSASQYSIVSGYTSWTPSDYFPNVTFYMDQGTLVTFAVAVTSGGCSETLHYTFVPISNPYSYSYYSLAPNPVSSDLTIYVDDEKLKKQKIEKSPDQVIQQVIILDKLGNVLLQQKYPADTRKVTMNVSGLSPDMYVAKIFNGKKWLAIKFLKK